MGNVVRSRIVVFTLGLLVGCSSAPEDEWTANRPATHPASGTVLLDGEALADALVTFRPKTGSKGTGAFGRTDEDGHFVLQTFEDGDGAVAGDYIVVVTKREAADSGDTRPEDLFAGMAAGAGKVVAPKSLVPERYADTSSSGLSAEVAAKGENEFRFELSTK